ncbi:tissue factor pathway inhibitor [Stomoxys calcitrans]|uniref:BPTI/Kunitz inhibitor domain-containing protein n=1 Tax=Stomoxys calcitrans TaxID=35570 RepID=A0A1I8PP11_STOCA|nr:tissue factor pathway inhibitor [Stomoxys calcitrans]
MWSSRGFGLLLAAIFYMGLMGISKADTKVVTTTTNKPPTKDPKCLLPKEPGPCRMRLDRFYYNVETDSCEEFVFGGCRGNENAFGFKETCEKACKGLPVPSIAMKGSTLKSLTADSAVTEKGMTTTSRTLQPEKIVMSTVTTPKPAQKAVVSQVTTPKPQVALKH